jgi:hypothetical protein
VVARKKRLKRAEKQNADHVAHSVKEYYEHRCMRSQNAKLKEYEKQSRIK